MYVKLRISKSSHGRNTHIRIKVIRFIENKLVGLLVISQYSQIQSLLIHPIDILQAPQAK